jgi:hypothetical protein
MTTRVSSLALAFGLYGTAFLSPAFTQTPLFFSPTTGLPYSAQEAADLLQQQKKAAIEAKWNIAVDVQMLAVPQDLALVLLPDLQSTDPSKVDAAVIQLQDLLKKKQAVLLGWPRAFVGNDQRASSETRVDKQFPSEFNSPQEAQTFSAPARPRLPFSLNPNSYEMRGIGPTLQVVPHVYEEEGGANILLRIDTSRTSFIRFDYYELGRTKEGHSAQIGQPKFTTTRTRTSVLVRNGKPALIGVHTSPEGYIELVIARAVATRTR